MHGMEKRLNMVHEKREKFIGNGSSIRNGNSISIGNGPVRSFAISFSLNKKAPFNPARATSNKTDITPGSVFDRSSPTDSGGEENVEINGSGDQLNGIGDHVTGGELNGTSSHVSGGGSVEVESLVPAPEPPLPPPVPAPLPPVEDIKSPINVKEDITEIRKSVGESERKKSPRHSSTRKRSRSKSKEGRKRRRSQSREHHRRTTSKRNRDVEEKSTTRHRSPDVERKPSSDRRNGNSNSTSTFDRNSNSISNRNSTSNGNSNSNFVSGRSEGDRRPNHQHPPHPPHPVKQTIKSRKERSDRSPHTAGRHPHPPTHPVTVGTVGTVGMGGMGGRVEKTPRNLTRLSRTRPRIFVSAVLAHAADFIQLWDGQSTFQKPVLLNGDIPLPLTPDSRESSVGVIIDEATNITEPTDMDIEEEGSGVQMAPLSVQVAAPSKVSFSMSKKGLAVPEKNGLKQPSEKTWMEEEEKVDRKLLILPVLTVPTVSTVVQVEENISAVYDSFLKDIQTPSLPPLSTLPTVVVEVVEVKKEEVELPCEGNEVVKKEGVEMAVVERGEGKEIETALALAPSPLLLASSVSVKTEETREMVKLEVQSKLEAGKVTPRPVSRMSNRSSPRRSSPRRTASRRSRSRSGSRSHRRSGSRRSRSPRRTKRVEGSASRRTRSRSPSRTARPFYSNITKNIQREMKLRRSGSKEKEHRSEDARRKQSPRKSRSRSPKRGGDRREVRRRSPEVRRGSLEVTRRSRGSRSPRDRQGSPRRRVLQDEEKRSSLDRADSARHEKDDGVERRFADRQTAPRWETGRDSPGISSPAGLEHKSDNMSKQPSPINRPAPAPRNGFPQRFAPSQQQHLYPPPSHAQPTPFRSTQPPTWPVTNVTSTTLDAEFPPTTEPVAGIFPVPFTFEGVGPIFCWPYYMPDGSIVLIPYLGLQKSPDASTVQHLVALPRWVDPVPLLLSGCPPGCTPLNLATIPTYDPTRAIPPPPPCSVAPLNQPTKPAVQKLARIQVKERERLKRLRAEKEKQLQPVFDTPTPTSESLSSKTMTPYEGGTTTTGGGGTCMGAGGTGVGGDMVEQEAVFGVVGEAGQEVI